MTTYGNKTHSLPRAECQICEGNWAMHHGILGYHGYKRPGFGELLNECYGVHARPYPEYDALERYLVALGHEVDRTTEALSALPGRSEITRWEPDFSKRRDRRTKEYPRHPVVYVRPTGTMVLRPERLHYTCDREYFEALDTYCKCEWGVWNTALARKADDLNRALAGYKEEVQRVRARIDRAKALNASAVAVSVGSCGVTPTPLALV